jgi:hypothetical protein
MIESANFPAIRPVLKPRACGGWIAASPAGSRFSVGVTAHSESEARERFQFTINRWSEIVDDETKEAAN